MEDEGRVCIKQIQTEKSLFNKIRGIFISIDKNNDIINIYGNNEEILGIDSVAISYVLQEYKDYCLNENLDEFNTLLDVDKGDYKHIQVKINNKRNEVKWLDIQGKTVREKDVVVGFEGYASDVTLKVDENNNVINKNLIDEITELHKNQYLRTQIEQWFLNNDNKKGAALIILGLDNFKYINDSFGKKYGDLFLKTISQKLKKNTKDDFICRHAGDEFLIFLKDIKSVYEAEDKAKELIEIFNNTYDINGKKIYVTTSIGVSIYSDHGDSFEKLLKNADAAMYIAKKKGKNQYQIFDDNIAKEIDKVYAIEKNLLNSIDNKEIFVVFQPKVILSNNKVNGFEALVRWKSKELGVISPTEFIPIAEETGLIVPIGKFVLKEVFRRAKHLLELGYENFKIAYNVSEVQLREGSILLWFEQLSKEYNVDGKYIEIEVTESMIIKSLDRNIRYLMKFKELGATVALDDFGTGYSSLNHLTKLPIDVLKIDRSFVADITENCKSKWIIENIIQLSHKLGIKVVAEGVEIEEQVKYLKDINCDTVQGYYYSRPQFFENVITFLHK